MTLPERTLITMEASRIAGNKLPQYLATYLATLSAVSAGAVLVWTSPALQVLDVPFTREQGSWIASLVTVGAFTGALPAGWLANLVGRKRLLVAAAGVQLASWLVIANASTVCALYVGRLLAGTTVGIISVAAPMYIAEVAESDVRGTLGTFFQLQMTVGALLMYLFGGYVRNATLISLAAAVIPVAFLCSFVWVPESPVYLLRNKQREDARKSLRWLRGPCYEVGGELNRLQESLEADAESKQSLRDVFRSKATTKALVIALGLMAFQQLSGVNAVFFYASNIFQSAGSFVSPTLAPIIIGTVQVIATYSSTLLIDRAGRRCLLLLSASVMAVCLAALGLYFHLRAAGCDISPISWLPIVSIALFVVVFSLGFGPIPWVIMAEIFPNNLKGICSALAAAFSWFMAFMVTKFFYDLLENLGTGCTFGLFSLFCVVGTVFVALMVPETKGKNVDEILNELAGTPSKERSESSISCDNIKVGFV